MALQFRSSSYGVAAEPVTAALNLAASGANLAAQIAANRAAAAERNTRLASLVRKREDVLRKMAKIKGKKNSAKKEDRNKYQKLASDLRGLDAAIKVENDALALKSRELDILQASAPGGGGIAAATNAITVSAKSAGPTFDVAGSATHPAVLVGVSLAGLAIVGATVWFLWPQR